MNFLEKSDNFANMFREAIQAELKKQRISQRKCARDNGIHHQNLNEFLLGKRSIPFQDIEKILQYLGIELSTNPFPCDT